MSYNQKVWLAVLVLCSVFWLTVIGGIFSAHEAVERADRQSQQELAARNTQSYHGTAAQTPAFQAQSPAS